jgi:hypothetical protein
MKNPSQASSKKFDKDDEILSAKALAYAEMFGTPIVFYSRAQAEAFERAIERKKLAREVAREMARRRPRSHAPAVADGALSAKQAAAFLGVSLTTFREVVQPEVPSTPVGRRLTFDRKDLEAWRLAKKVAGNFVSHRGARSTSSGSGTLANGSIGPRAGQILAKLRSRRRGSTAT